MTARAMIYKPRPPGPPYKNLWTGKLTHTGPSALTRTLLLNPDNFTGQVQRPLNAALDRNGRPADATNETFVYTIDSVEDVAAGSVATVSVWYVAAVDPGPYEVVYGEAEAALEDHKRRCPICSAPKLHKDYCAEFVALNNDREAKRKEAVEVKRRATRSR